MGVGVRVLGGCVTAMRGVSRDCGAGYADQLYRGDMYAPCINGRRSARMLSNARWSSGAAPARFAWVHSFMLSDGYHMRPSSDSVPPPHSFFHWLSVSFIFFTGRHISPRPLIVPWPVIDMSCLSNALIGDTHSLAGLSATSQRNRG